MNIKKVITSSVAAGAILVNMTLPVLASTTTLEISGNGANTDNDSTVTVVNSVTVVQSNDADIDNDVDVSSNTGHNDANDNVGGNVEIDTGDVDTGVTIVNSANSNVADVDGCCGQDLDVLISGNARDTDNTATLDSATVTSLFQNNEADVDNDVDVDSTTGENRTNDNVGGDVKVTTGDVNVAGDGGIRIYNTLNSNSARVGGEGGALSLSARIIGNGRNSDNDIELSAARILTVAQDNEADVDNDVDVYSNTGHNEAKDNVEGNVEVDTGDVNVKVMLDTMANFNWANVDCDCLGDVFAKVANNVRGSDNDITAKLISDMAVFQDNCGDGAQAADFGGSRPHHHWDDCGVDNDVDAYSTTGDNDANDNGGDVDSDPIVETGNVDVNVGVSNSGNSNAYGQEAPAYDYDLPYGGFNLNITLDWGDLLGFLGL